MVLGIAGFVVCGVGAILALVFGYKAKREIDGSGGMQKGRGMAIAGIVLGWVWVALIVVVVIIAFAVPTDS
jgi:dipeptide/tripeptide permease